MSDAEIVGTVIAVAGVLTLVRWGGLIRMGLRG
jgi:hypothetical protein